MSSEMCLAGNVRLLQGSKQKEKVANTHATLNILGFRR